VKAGSANFVPIEVCGSSFDKRPPSCYCLWGVLGAETAKEPQTLKTRESALKGHLAGPWVADIKGNVGATRDLRKNPKKYLSIKLHIF